MTIKQTLYLATIASPFDEGNFGRVFKARAKVLGSMFGIYAVLLTLLFIVSAVRDG